MILKNYQQKIENEIAKIVWPNGEIYQVIQWILGFCAAAPKIGMSWVKRY